MHYTEVKLTDPVSAFLAGVKRSTGLTYFSLPLSHSSSFLAMSFYNIRLTQSPALADFSQPQPKL